MSKRPKARRPPGTTKPAPSIRIAKPNAPIYREIAELIAGPDAPPWLSRFFLNHAPSLALDYHVHDRLMGRASMLEVLKKTGEAAALIRRALSDGNVRAFLEDNPLGPIPDLGELNRSLTALAIRVALALQSSQLVNEDGKAKAGQGKARTSRSYPPPTYCALIIAETWHYFQNDYPADSNRNAARSRREACWNLLTQLRAG